MFSKVSVFSTSIEYREDTISYDENKTKYFRQKINLNPNKNFSINYTYILENNKFDKYTYNIKYNKPSLNLFSIIGNYNINFGKGLILGKKMMISTNKFNQTIAISHDKIFSKTNSGNPIYPFHGIGISYFHKLSNFKFSIHPFYSFRKRFTTIDESNNYVTTSSINSILLKYKKDYSRNNPINIKDKGVMLQSQYLKYFTFQLYSFETTISSNSGEPFFWSYRKEDDYSISKSENFGFFSQYKDDYISLFYEVGNTVLYSPNKGKTDGIGNLFGLKFKHPIIKLSTIYHQNKKNFNTPYSSSNGYPLTSYSLNTSLKINKKSKISSSLFTKKKLSISNSSYSEKSQTESLTFNYHLFGKSESYIKLTKHQSENQKENEKDYQIKCKISKTINKKVKYIFLSKFQHDNNKNKSTGITQKVTFKTKKFKSNLAFSNYFISNNNYIYTKISPLPKSVAGGSYIKENSSDFTFTISYKIKSISLAARLYSQFNFSKFIKNGLEFSFQYSL